SVPPPPVSDSSSRSTTLPRSASTPQCGLLASKDAEWLSASYGPGLLRLWAIFASPGLRSKPPTLSSSSSLLSLSLLPPVLDAHGSPVALPLPAAVPSRRDDEAAQPTSNAAQNTVGSRSMLTS